MSTIPQMSARIYSGILSLYPSELRREFGAEMTQVFVEDMEDSYRTRGIAGAARVWWRSVKEMWRIALPEQASKREIAVPFIVFVLNELQVGALLLSACEKPSGATGLVDVGQVIATGLMFGLIPALIAFLAIRAGNRGVPDPLVLGPK